ncbi:unnamed protein product [Leptidea sinapis]|uniref:ZAD domain-containing protein n=1 Tax=Leptidea sinapis TaxID=189913 RepID=A0A5E4QZJ9_9NEOP|nr:unnamed protein product [Leptidea sinapis]
MADSLCWICLNKSDKMYCINNYLDLRSIYNFLTGIQESNKLSIYICYICTSLLLKFNKLRKQAIQAQILMIQYIHFKNPSIYQKQVMVWSHKSTKTPFKMNRLLRQSVKTLGLPPLCLWWKNPKFGNMSEEHTGVDAQLNKDIFQKLFVKPERKEEAAVEEHALTGGGRRKQ